MTGYDKIDHAILTDVGIRRSHNQDNHAVFLAADNSQWQQRGHVFLVADGMGGHAVGEMASELASTIIPHTYEKHAAEGPGLALRKAFLEANASIHARGQQNPEFTGMGTTTTTLLLRPEGAWIGHVGDSRAYRIRNGQIDQLSFDHSLVWEIAKRQRLDPEELGFENRNNIIVRSLGPDPLVEVDLEGPHPVQNGDIYLLCSDGLSGPVSDLELGAVAGLLPPTEACRFLVNLANLRGGPDNITVMIIRVGERSRSGTPEAVSPGIPWYQRISWSLSFLFLGVFLSGGAVALALAQKQGSIPLSISAGAALLVGLTGLAIHHFREKEARKAEAESPLPRVYRQASCQVDRPLVDKLVKAEDVLKQRVVTQQLELNWDHFQNHHQLAEQTLSKGDLAEAFREYCRAITILTDAMQRSRSKEELFQPLWDVKKES